MCLTPDVSNAYHTSAMTATLRLSPPRIAGLLYILAALFAALGLLGDWLGSVSSAEYIWPLLRQFDFVEEGNLVNWYQSGALLLCALLAAVVAAVAGRGIRNYRWHWAGIAAVFLFLSADESAQLHETTLTPFLQDAAIRFGHGNVAEAGDAHVGPAMKKAYWMLPYLVVLLGLAIAYARFIRDLPAATRTQLILAAALYLSGAVGTELLTNLLSDWLGGQTLVYQVINNVSELLEMLGVALSARALLGHLATSSPRIELLVAPTD